MSRRAWCAIGVAALAMPAFAAQPAEGHRLQHDPFSREPVRSSSFGTAPAPSSAAASSAGATPTATLGGAAASRTAAVPASPVAAAEPALAAAEAAPDRLPVLRALLRAASRPMANVDGTLLEIGESFDGLRLVEIGEYSARFVRDGKPIELRLGQGGGR